MFDYLPEDAPVRDYTPEQCHIGYLRRCAEHYASNGVITELEMVAHYMDPQECSFYLTAMTDIKSKLHIHLTENVFGDRTRLAKQVMLDLLILQAALHTRANWSIVDDILSVQILTSRHGPEVLNTYLRKLSINRAQGDLLKFYWHVISESAIRYAVATTQET